MNYYQIKLGLNGSQSQIMDRIKSAGAEVIQVSDGLCIKGDHSLAELQAIVGQETSGVSVQALNKEDLAKNPDTPTDVKTFLGI